VFENIMKNSPSLLEKVCCLEGEMSLPYCGLDKTTLELIRNVEVVIHCAAAIRFNMAVSKILKLNVGGTYNVLSLAERMTNLKAFVYVSTAFLMHSKTPVEEKVYKTKIEPLEALETFQKMPPEWLSSVNEKYGWFPINSYSNFSEIVFENIMKNSPSLLEKVCCLEGEMSLPYCGLDKTTLELIRNVEVVIHCAAAIRFNMAVSKILKLNVGGTYNVLSLAERMTNLKAFVYVSTAFLMHSKTPVEEKVYKTKIEPLEALETFQKMPPEWLSSVNEKILEQHPNTYSFSKRMAENLVESFKDQLPVCIVRPAAILAACKGPFPGWNDTSASISQFYHLIFTGAYQTILINPKTRAPITPVDYAVNTILAAAWRRGTFSDSGFVVYNCVPKGDNTVLNEKIVKWGFEATQKKSNSVMRYMKYPAFSTSEIIFQLKTKIFFMLRSFPLNACRSERRKASLAKHQMKAFILAHVFKMFTLNDWEFLGSNMQKLCQMMSPHDRQIFYTDFAQINWECFTKDFAEGLGRF
ncbi:unnamed protein product, partial [Allacma fusca]